MHCDDSGKWAVADLALATASLFLFVNADGEGFAAYGATAGTVVFTASSILGFRNTRRCRCLHEIWLEGARLR